jgi:hypothetical protein
MVSPLPLNRPYMKALCLLASLLFSAACVSAQKPKKPKQMTECSVSKTNESCWLIIDRKTPVAPPQIQMYSGESITVVVKQPNTFERYFLDYQSGQATVTPDVASAIVQGLMPSLPKTAEFKSNEVALTAETATDVCANIATLPLLTPGKGDDLLQVVQICIGQLSAKSTDIYRKLEPLIAPDSITPVNTQKVNSCDLRACIAAFLLSENAFSARIAILAADPNLKDATTKDWKKPEDGVAIAQVLALQKIADQVATDLQSYAVRLDDLPTTTAALAANGFQDCKNVIPMPAEKAGETPLQCVVLKSQADKPQVYQNMVTRTITYALNTYNLVSYSQEAAPDPSKKKLLASVAINFADTTKVTVASALRWEASAGVFFSTLPIRSFAVAPVFTNGVITDKTISQNILHPTVVPFAAGNFRLTNDLNISRWKSNLYWTGAVGVNPNTVSADFATGPSLSWRALMVSALAHFGHDTRLTQGLTVGESLGASFNGSLPTQTHWTTSFAVGLSVRIPALTGR